MLKSKMFGYLVLSGTATLLSGCVDPATYAQMPSSQLCIDYMTLPSMNINQGAREQELARRGESCSAYGSAAAARNQANKNFEDGLRALQNQ